MRVSAPSRHLEGFLCHVHRGPGGGGGDVCIQGWRSGGARPDARAWGPSPFMSAVTGPLREAKDAKQNLGLLY